MQAYNDTILTAQGNGLVPYANATVTVYLASTTTLASLFSNNGTTVQVNPFQASSLGVVKFYAVDGRYDIKITGTGFATVNLTDVLLEDFRAPATAASISTTVGGFTRTQQARNNDVVNVKDYGAVADGVTDDYPAFLAARNSLSIRGGTIKVPAGIYKINSTINYDGISVILDGDGTSNQPTGGATTLLFAAGIVGIIMRNNINGLGASSIVRNMKLVGSDVSAGTNDGIRVQAHAAGVDNVCVTGFGGSGIHVLSGNPSDGAINTNNFWIKNVRCNLNWLHGFFVEGLDSNVGLIENLDCSDNKQWGIYENGFLGNTYSAPHCDNNLAGDYRIGNIGRGNTFIGAYCEIRATTGLQFDAGGPGGNYLQFSVFGSTIIDNSANQDNIILSSSNYLNFKHLGIGKGNQGNATRFRVSGFDLAGLSQYGVYADPVVANPCNNWATYTSYVSTATATFTLAQLTHFQVGGIFSPGAGSTVTTQTGFLVPNITGATTNIGYRGQIVAATNAWNLFMDGTAANFLQGAVTLGNGSAGTPSINWVGATTSGLHHYGTYGTAIDVGAFAYFGVNNNGSYTYAGMGSGISFGWSAGTDITVSDALDTILVRDGAGIIGQKNAANTQEYRVYGTTTGPKYLSLKHDGTNAIVSANSGAVLFQTSATTYGQLSSAGVWSLGGAAGAESLQITPIASAVNSLRVGGGIAGNGIILETVGASAAINLDYYTKTTGTHNFHTGGGRDGALQVAITDTASAVNLHQLTGSATGNPINWAAAGTDANIAIRVAPKGTGNVLIDGGSSGVAQTLQIKNTGVNGAGIALFGDGGTTPNKTIRVAAGVFQIVNNAFSLSILSLTDAGALTVSNTLNMASYTVATLPTGVQGDNAYVTNALGPTYGAAVAGGGTVVNRVFKNATQWVCA